MKLCVVNMPSASLSVTCFVRLTYVNTHWLASTYNCTLLSEGNDFFIQSCVEFSAKFLLLILWIDIVTFLNLFRHCPEGLKSLIN